MRYQAVLLDADDTLFDFGAAETAAFRRFLIEIELNHPDAFREYERINTACWLDLECGRTTPSALRIRRFREFLSLYEHPIPPERAAELYETLLGEQAILLPGALEAVREIAGKLPIAIVTNGIGRVQRARLARSPLNEYISALIISEDVGVSKPDPRMIFEALAALGMPEERRVLMVGDSLKSDIAAAVRAGVPACWVNRLKEVRPLDLPVAYEIESVAALSGIALAQ